jgi:hypothetical protein
MQRFVYDAMEIWIFLAKFIKLNENLHNKNLNL